jgi:ElaB/YqjD/DUF883 family membrane-anchored ribosome-binding protein
MAELNTEAVRDNREVVKLREDVEKLKSDLKNLMDAAKEMGLDQTDQTRSRLKNFISNMDDRVREGISDTYENVRRQGDRAVQVSRETVQERPIATVLASFLAGVVLGRIIFK